MPDIFNRTTEPDPNCAPIVQTGRNAEELAKRGCHLPGVSMHLTFPEGCIDNVKLELKDNHGEPINIGLIQKLTVTLDAMEMLPKAVMEFIPTTLVIHGQVDAEFKPITLFADTDKDSNGNEFSRQFTLDRSEPVFVKPAESSDGKVD